MRRERDKTYIYGKHALIEALLNSPQMIRKVFLSSEINDPELRELLRKNDIPVAALKERETARLVGHDASHQGVIGVIDTTSLLTDFKDFIAKLEPTVDTCLVLLDELNDPHNVGAIIRSAAAFGASGILIPPHNQAPITGAVVKASAGMTFRVPLVSIGNVNQSVISLKKMGFRAYALAMEGARSVSKERFDAPALFIVGNEAEGIREKTLEHSDVTLRIPINPRCESLNVSVSAAVVLYEWSTQRQEALKRKSR